MNECDFFLIQFLFDILQKKEKKEKKMNLLSFCITFLFLLQLLANIIHISAN